MCVHQCTHAQWPHTAELRAPCCCPRYIKVVGGPEGREGLLVGLKGGMLLQVFIDNPFPVVLAQHTAPVRCLDLSPSRTRVAVVDDSAQLSLYDLATKVGTAGGRCGCDILTADVDHLVTLALQDMPSTVRCIHAGTPQTAVHHTLPIDAKQCSGACIKPALSEPLCASYPCSRCCSRSAASTALPSTACATTWCATRAEAAWPSRQATSLHTRSACRASWWDSR
jgi:hypothetical protein